VYSVKICLMICHGNGSVVLVLKSGLLSNDVAVIEMPACSAVNSAKLKIARKACLPREAAWRRGMDEEP